MYFSEALSCGVCSAFSVFIMRALKKSAGSSAKHLVTQGLVREMNLKAALGLGDEARSEQRHMSSEDQDRRIYFIYILKRRQHRNIPSSLERSCRECGIFLQRLV